MTGPLVRFATTAAAGAAAVVARRAVDRGWQLGTGRPPPGEQDHDATLRDVVLWSMLAAGTVVLAQRIATRGITRLLER